MVRQTRPLLAIIILGFMCWTSLATQSALAEWTGWPPGSTYATADEACQSYVDYRGTWLNGMIPQFNNIDGLMTSITCVVKHWFGTGNVNDPTHVTCPAGFSPNGWITGACTKNPSSKEKGCPQCPAGNNPKVGNPITLAAGNKFERVTDFETAGPDTLGFTRFYNSFEVHDTTLGIGWRSIFDRRLRFISSTQIDVEHADGSGVTFALSGGVWSSDADVTEKLVDNSGTWTLTTNNDTVETYNSNGHLTSIVTRNGYTQTLLYNGSNQLTTVTDTYNRQLTFTYADTRLATMTDPDGEVYTYTCDKIISDFEYPNRLITVMYPDNTPTDSSDNPTVTYLYEDAAFPYALTGILDEHGDRYATFAYDAEGRATLSEHANGADHTTVAYNSDISRTVTNPLGQQTTYLFSWIEGARKVIQVDRLATATVPAATSSRTYDANGFLASRTDWNGNITTFINNSRGLQTSRTEASGTAQVRTITTAWHSTFRLPSQIQEPGKTTDFTYDANGFLLTRTETDTTGGSTNGQTRTWTYTYTTNGQLATVNGPRTAVTDLTTNTYTTEGYLKTVTNALSHVTDITSHSSRGLPLIMKDANNIETHLAYDARGRLTSTTVKSAQGDAVTTFEYDAVGQLTRITRPDGSILEYEYDAAHRVTAVKNNLGERIEYTLDATGNRTAETVKSSTSTIVRTQSRTFDTISRLLTQVGASTQTTTYAYDANGNTITITDPLTHATTQAFDALNRLTKVTDAKTGEADYTYDGQDNLATVDDQRDLTTTYVYNGFGEVIQLTSPDTGVTTYQTDSAGNRTQQTDARSIVTTYTFDALNRVTTMQFPGNTAENVTYTYDDQTSGNKGLGRLTGIADQSGTTALTYNDRGNVITEVRAIGAQTYTTNYAYDLADNLAQVTYPSGRMVTYQRDAQGRVSAVLTQANASAAPQLLASNIGYQPFGPMTSLTYGNGLNLNLSYDQDYRLTDIKTDDGATVIQDLDYTYDNADNITAIADMVNATRNQSLGYDELHRLTSASGAYPALTYTYDAVGNRLTKTQSGTTETYAYATTSNQLQSATVGGTTRSFTYTANGQITTDARTPDTYGLTYNHQNRLNQLTKNSVADKDYRYNALGQRVLKDRLGVGTTDTHYHYDRDGRLLAETDDQGTLIREYIAIDGLPLAVIDAGTTHSPTLDLILDNTDTGVTTSGTWTTATTGSGYEGVDYLAHAAEGIPPGGTLIENGSAAFSVTGTWTTSSAVPGFSGTNYHKRTPAPDAPAEIMIDNGGAGFSTLGFWPTSTNVAGYEGTNYQVRGGYGLPPTTEYIDNTDTGFSVTGTWPASSNVAGYQGTDYQVHLPNDLPPASIILDNVGTGTSSVGSWNATTNVPGYWATNYFWHLSAAGTSFTWTPTIPSQKLYHVYARWLAHVNHPTNAVYTVHHQGGSTPVTVNQEINGGQWMLLGSFTLAPSLNHRVVLSGVANGVIIADAVAFVPDDALPNTATWQPTILTSGDYEVHGKWPAHANHPSNAPYTIVHASGSTTVPTNQQINGGQWNLLGTFTFDPNEDHRIELTDQANGVVIADAVAVAPVEAPPNTAIWTPTITVPDDYEVYAKWPAHATHPSAAPYTVHHASGSTTVPMNQQINGGQWNLVGTFTLQPGQNHRVELTDQATGVVIADAVKFVPAPNTTNTATWTPTIATSDGYEVYTRWTSHQNRATDATYTIHHQGGNSSVVVNQQNNGNEWQLLGTYNFDPSANHRVELDDDANGTVVADAVYIATASTAQNNVTWEPTLASSALVDVYATWVDGADRSDAVTYTVHHAGGSTTINMNQKQNGGTWNWLGQFTMNPSSNHRVEMTDSSDGVVVADAVRFVSVTTSGAGLMYVHSDHLGTPQKMTDSSQALVWDAVYQPFGEAHSITGTASNNQRFPGQYADAESGFSYNYFRDYDSTTGRYVQSDPIGLGGGMNTYVYGINNSLRFIDPWGLDVWAGGEFTGGVHLGPFGIFAGGGAIGNPQTGETCTFATICGRGGLGILIAGGGKGVGSVNGPKCGIDLQGASVGLGGEIVSPGGPGLGGNVTAGVNVESSGGNLSLDLNGAAGTGVSLGPSFGAGISGGIDGCYTKILGCTNTPAECKNCSE